MALRSLPYLGLLGCSLALASDPVPQEEGRSRPRGVIPETSQAGPFAPVFRYLEGKPITIYRTQEGRDPARGFMAPMVRTRDGGYLLSAYRDDRTEEEKRRKNRQGYGVYVTGKSVPLLIRLDEAGRLVWERTYKKAGFVSYEGGWTAEGPDGHFLVMVPSWINPGVLPVQRYLKVHREDGRVLWELQLRGDGGPHTPVSRIARVDQEGSLHLDGHVYLVKGDEARLWKGEISPDGRLRSDQVGPIMPAVGEGPVVFDDLHNGYRSWVRNRVARTREPERPAYLFALNQKLALAHHRWHLPAGQGWMIPVIRPTRGGLLLVGVREVHGAPGQTQPVVIRMDDSGTPQWERTLEGPGFDAYAGGLALEAPGGDLLVLIPSQDSRTMEQVPRLFRLRPTGEVV